MHAGLDRSDRERLVERVLAPGPEALEPFLVREFTAPPDYSVIAEVLRSGPYDRRDRHLAQPARAAAAGADPLGPPH